MESINSSYFRQTWRTLFHHAIVFTFWNILFEYCEHVIASKLLWKNGVNSHTLVQLQSCFSLPFSGGERGINQQKNLMTHSIVKHQCAGIYKWRNSYFFYFQTDKLMLSSIFILTVHVLLEAIRNRRKRGKRLLTIHVCLSSLTSFALWVALTSTVCIAIGMN